MNKLLTNDNYWIELGLPLWQDASGFREQTHCEEHGQTYSVFKPEVAYCSFCGKTLEYEEGRESYE